MYNAKLSFHYKTFINLTQQYNLWINFLFLSQDSLNMFHISIYIEDLNINGINPLYYYRFGVISLRLNINRRKLISEYADYYK